MIRSGIAMLFVVASAVAFAKPAIEDKYATNGDVRIHYAVTGNTKDPLVVMIHGFPDFWLTWRHQMSALADKFRIAAIDQRGYNLSDKPTGVDAYRMPNLVADIGAVIHAEGRTRAIVVGHDWGGAVAWSVAMSQPDWVDLLVILNLPHPAGLAREIANNPDQKRNSQYAFEFQKPDAASVGSSLFGPGPLTPEKLAGWVADDTVKAQYVDAFRRSDIEAMLNYYKANYPRPDAPPPAEPPPPPPKVKVPVLMFHGLDDQALLPGALNGTWQWLEKDLTLVTIPGAGHFVQQDAADLVSATLRDWLLRRTGQSR
jgi:pimeloyl-ACP methyl ester carboxylesterase